MTERKIKEESPELNSQEAVNSEPKDTELIVDSSSPSKEEKVEKFEEEEAEALIEIEAPVIDKTETLFSIFNTERKAIAATPSKHILRPRALTEQLALPVSAYFGSIADSKLLKKAQKKVEEGAAYGLVGGALAFKIMKAIEILLYEISEIYLTEEQLKAKDSDKQLYLLGSNTNNTLAERIKLPAEAEFTGTPIGTPQPCIITTPFIFAKKVYGGDNPTGKRVNEVLEELEKFGAKRILVYRGNAAFTSPLNYSIYANDKRQQLLHITLNPIFAQMIGEKFVRERKDILTLLKGVTKDMTLTLYEILITKLSLGFPYFHINPKKLYEQIAKISSYKKNRKRMKEDFNYSVEVMKRIRLITDYSETVTECKFIFNKNHIQETFENYPETRFSSIFKSKMFSLNYGEFFP